MNSKIAILTVNWLIKNDEYKIDDMCLQTAGILEFNEKMIDRFDNIDTLFWEINRKDIKTIYVDNLNLLYIYLINYLAVHEYKFSYSYKSGKCSNIRVENLGVTFINFKSKFGIDFMEDSSKNWELIEYALEKERCGISLGADAWNEFIAIYTRNRYKSVVAHKIMREDNHYPIFDYNFDLLEAKEHVSGFQMCKQGRYSNIYEYDISSSYPAQALCDMPCGLPKEYSNVEEVPASYFKIIKFTYFNCTIKKDKFEFIKTSAIGTLCLTEKLFELFNENYNCNIIIKKVYAFKTQKSPFNEFIKKNIIEGKQKEKRPHIAKYNKYIGNSIIGYFGRNTISTENCANLHLGQLNLQSQYKTIPPVYLPVYLAVLDKAKAQFIRIIQQYQDCIIYANTDGFLSTCELSTDLLNISNSLPIGNYRCKNIYADIYIDCINGYSAITVDGEINNTLAGMRLDDLINPSQYQQRQFTYYVNIPTTAGTIKRQKISL